MHITLAVGIFFLVLAVAFAVAARGDYLAAQRQWFPAGKTRRRVAVIFALVGLGLVLYRLLS